MVEFRMGNVPYAKPHPVILCRRDGTRYYSRWRTSESIRLTRAGWELRSALLSCAEEELKNRKLSDNGGVDGVGSYPSVRRANLDGTGMEILASGGRPSDVALDVTGGKMYWTDWAGNKNIWRANLDGSNAEVVISGQLSDPSGIALDLVNGKMYITDEGGMGGVGSIPSVSRANLDGTGWEMNGKLYWTDWVGNNNVWQSDLDGTNAHAIITGQFSDPNGIDVDPYLGKIYIADSGGSGGIGSSPSIASARPTW